MITRRVKQHWWLPFCFSMRIFEGWRTWGLQSLPNKVLTPVYLIVVIGLYLFIECQMRTEQTHSNFGTSHMEWRICLNAVKSLFLYQPLSLSALESQSRATVLEDAIPTCIYYVSNPVLHASLSQDAPLRSVGVQSQTAWWQGRKLWSSGGEYRQSTKGLTPPSPSLTESFSNSLSSISAGHVNYF